MVFQLFMLLSFIYIYAFSVYVDTNICLISEDVNDNAIV